MTSSSCSKKAFFFTTDITSIGTLMLSKGPWAWWMIYIKLQTHLRSLRKRTSLLFAISDKHSGRLLNFLCCFLYLKLGLCWVIHVWASDFKPFQENENLKLSLGWAFAHSFKAPPWGDWKKYVKIEHETVVNGVYSLLCQRPTCKTGSNDAYFKRIFKRCKNM